MSPFNWVIYPLTQPQVANQQQKSVETVDFKTKNLQKIVFIETLSFQEVRPAGRAPVTIFLTHVFCPQV